MGGKKGRKRLQFLLRFIYITIIYAKGILPFVKVKHSFFFFSGSCKLRWEHHPVTTVSSTHLSTQDCSSSVWCYYASLPQSAQAINFLREQCMLDKEMQLWDLTPV